MTVEADRSAPSAIYPDTLYEALQKVTEIEILIRRISEETGTGRHRSLFAGTGADFQEIREYHFGDDIRAIDWNCTAQFCEPYIRVFQEEHDLAIYLVVDRSASGTFGTERSKDETIFEIAASIIISAQIFGDRIGLCLFTDGVEVFIPLSASSPSIRVRRPQPISVQTERECLKNCTISMRKTVRPRSETDSLWPSRWRSPYRIENASSFFFQTATRTPGRSPLRRRPNMQRKEASRYSPWRWALMNRCLSATTGRTTQNMRL